MYSYTHTLFGLVVRLRLMSEECICVLHVTVVRFCHCCGIPHHMHMPELIYPVTTDGQLGGFQVLAIMNAAARNIRVRVFCGVSIHLYWAPSNG